MATHSSILAWRIPWTGKPGGLQSMGLQRVRLNWMDIHLSYSIQAEIRHWVQVPCLEISNCSFIICISQWWVTWQLRNTFHVLSHSLSNLSKNPIDSFFVVYFWLCWVFMAVLGLSLVVEIGGCSLVAMCWLLLSQSTDSRAHRL